jgi:multiple sugar transport system substrate-binding protein
MTRDTNHDGKTDVWGTTLPPWQIVVWASGANYVDDAEHPKRYTFDDPKVIQAIQWIADARLKDKVTAKELVQTEQVDPFMAGRVAMTWNGHWQIPDYIPKAKFHWDVGMPPVGAGGRAGFNFGSCFSILKKSKHPDEAWKVIEFFCSPEGSRIFAMSNSMTPVSLAVAHSAEFLNLHPPEHQKYFIDAMECGHLEPKTPAYKELINMTNMELERVWSGAEAPATVCKRIAQKGTQILKGNGATPAR